MTYTEYVTHFSLWCLMKAPLLIGCDIRSLSPQTLHILTNKDAIAVNQDPLGVQGHKLRSKNDLELWAGPLRDGSKAVILLNRSSQKASISVEASELGWKHGVCFVVYDIWQRQDIGEFCGSFSANVESHGVMFGRFRPVQVDFIHVV